MDIISKIAQVKQMFKKKKETFFRTNWVSADINRAFIKSFI